VLALLLTATLLHENPKPAQTYQRPRDLWVFRSVLDRRARIVTIALSDQLWVAYDATNCGLYKAWFGGVKFDGAVYTAVHGPQPTSQGRAYMMGEVDKPVWQLTVGGRQVTVKPEFKGYRLNNNQITLNYRIPVAGGRYAIISETPEYFRGTDGRPGLDRRFTVQGLPRDAKLSVAVDPGSLGNPNDFQTDGRWTVVSTDRVERGARSEYDLKGRLELNTDRPTRAAATFLPFQSAEQESPEDGAIAGHGPLALTEATPQAQQEPDIQKEARQREPGLAVRVYDIGQQVSRVPILVASQTANRNYVVRQINLSTKEDFGGFSENFLAILTGYINVTKLGRYSFRLTSDDGSKFSIRDTVVVDNDGLHGATPKDGEFDLDPGEHPFRIDYFQGAADATLKLEWKVPGSNKFELVPPEAFTTPAGEVRVTSPGRKNVLDPMSLLRPGDQSPVGGVHPSYALTTLRPKDFKPRVGGIDFLPDGRMVICNWEPEGGVYIVDGIQGDARNVRVKRIAAGLAEPLGIKVVGKDIYVLQKQELTKLIDHNGDDVIDEYFAVANGWGVTSNFHEFAFGLVYKNGHFYANLATAINPGGSSTQPQNPDRGKVIKIAPNGSFEFVAHGLRTPNGIGLGYRNEIFITDNQGDWLPSSKLLHFKPGAFFGSRSVNPTGTQGLVEMPPVVWLPQGEIGNSPSEPILLVNGPYKGQMAHGDVTYGGLQRVFVENIEGQLQGVVFRMTQGLEAGINRVKSGPDGAIYVGGIGSTGNWGQEGKERFGLQKLTYTGKPTFEMLAVRAMTNGVEIEFTQPIAEGVGEAPREYMVDMFRYQPTAEYGGPKLDETQLPVRSVTLSRDRKKAFLELQGMKPGRVVHVRLDSGIASANGLPLWSTEAWYTLNRIPTNRMGRVAPMPVTPFNQLSPAEQKQGFQLLFDGRTVNGWQGWGRKDMPKGWSAKDGALTLTPGLGGGDIRTVEEYGDFDLRLDWRVGPAGNSGIFYRAKEGKGPGYLTGPEYQLLDNIQHPDGRNAVTSTGSSYALYPPTQNVVRPVGEWNTTRIVAKGNRIEHWLNGVKVVEYEINSPEWRERYLKSKFRGMAEYGKYPAGYLVLQDHGDPVSFRNIRIKRL